MREPAKLHFHQRRVQARPWPRLGIQEVPLLQKVHPVETMRHPFAVFDDLLLELAQEG